MQVSCGHHFLNKGVEIFKLLANANVELVLGGDGFKLSGESQKERQKRQSCKKNETKRVYEKPPVILFRFRAKLKS